MVEPDQRETGETGRSGARFGMNVLGAVVGIVIGLLLGLLVDRVEWWAGAGAGLLIGTGLGEVIDRRYG